MKKTTYKLTQINIKLYNYYIIFIYNRVIMIKEQYSINKKLNNFTRVNLHLKCNFYRFRDIPYEPYLFHSNPREDLHIKFIIL